MIELKIQIEQTLKQFASGAPRDCTRKLLNVLGYESDKTDDIEPNSFKGFKEYFLSSQNTFNEKTAKADEWQSIDIIFQLTDVEMTAACERHCLTDNKSPWWRWKPSWFFFVFKKLDALRRN